MSGQYIPHLFLPSLDPRDFSVFPCLFHPCPYCSSRSVLFFTSLATYTLSFICSSTSPAYFFSRGSQTALKIMENITKTSVLLSLTHTHTYTHKKYKMKNQSAAAALEESKDHSPSLRIILRKHLTRKNGRLQGTFEGLGCGCTDDLLAPVRPLICSPDEVGIIVTASLCSSSIRLSPVV